MVSKDSETRVTACLLLACGRYHTSWLTTNQCP